MTDLWSVVIAQHLRTLSQCDLLGPSIAQTTKRLRTTLECGGKIILCGNGGSLAHAQHFAAELAVRYKRDRSALAAICLGCNPAVVTAIVNDLGPDRLFSRELLAVYRPLDTLVAFSTSGRSANVLNALDQATQCSLSTVGITGAKGMATLVSQEIRVPSEDTARIQEIHQLIIHTLCEGLDA